MINNENPLVLDDENPLVFDERIAYAPIIKNENQRPMNFIPMGITKKTINSATLKIKSILDINSKMPKLIPNLRACIQLFLNII